MTTVFKIEASDEALSTIGLEASGHRELRLLKHPECNEMVLNRLLDIAGTHSLSKGESYKDGEKITLMSWIYELRERDNFLELDELSADGERFVKGCAFSEKLISAQLLVCEKLCADPHYARTDQMVAVSDEVLSGGTPIEGVRYPSPDHMSGWWITTDSYNGDTSTLKTVHMGHIIAARNDVPAFLALPFGYRFRMDSETNVWFDPEAEKEA